MVSISGRTVAGQPPSSEVIQLAGANLVRQMPLTEWLAPWPAHNCRSDAAAVAAAAAVLAFGCSLSFQQMKLFALHSISATACRILSCRSCPSLSLFLTLPASAAMIHCHGGIESSTSNRFSCGGRSRRRRSPSLTHTHTHSVGLCNNPAQQPTHHHTDRTD